MIDRHNTTKIDSKNKDNNKQSNRLYSRSYTYTYMYVTTPELKAPQQNLKNSLEIAINLAVLQAPNIRMTSKQPTIDKKTLAYSEQIKQIEGKTKDELTFSKVHDGKSWTNAKQGYKCIPVYRSFMKGYYCQRLK